MSASVNSAGRSAAMSAERNILAICSFFQSDSLIERTIATLGAVADLYLVPIEPGTPAPEIAQPFLAARKLAVDPQLFSPCKKWRTINLILDRVRVDQYDYAIFPDDDLEYCADFVPEFFDLLDTHDVALAQPALTADSYHTYDICIRREEAILRFTNFVEVMTPCFRRDCLRQLRPTWASDISPMGYGFDLHWPYVCSQAGFQMAIVDATPVSHRFRPTGKHYAGDDLHGQGYAYGQRFPRILAHEICEVGKILRPARGKPGTGGPEPPRDGPAG